VPGISFGLEETRYDNNVPDGDKSCLVLEADKLLIVLGKAVPEFFPPSLLRRILGEREKVCATGPRDPVVVEQSLDFPWPQAGPGPLVPADLGGRPVQRGSDRFPVLVLALPDLAEFGGEPNGLALSDHLMM
jgi:hypothetical protein